MVYAYLNGPLGPNFHVVTEGPQAMYRSGQLHPDDLEERVKKHNIKTVLNLRGKNPGEDWYIGERQRAAELGIEFVSIAMSARFLMSRDIMVQIIDVLETRPRPILVHCLAGVDRSGLISALERLLKDPADMKGARAQLAIFPYGHTGLGKAVRMDEFLDIYERYRQSGGKLGLRAWVETVYDPQ
ncbi:MAG: tyrosine-protein phosphatase [Phycisphaerae bacterium]|nr:tyrosine-protein phosphatase [Phycisphaerae bacterium]